MVVKQQVSLFRKLYKFDMEETTLEEIIILIRTRRWRLDITAYRAALVAGRKEEAQRLKGNLPGFTPSGVFRGGHKASQLVSYNQVVGLDFDHVERVDEMVACFHAIPYTRAHIISPGASGVKVFISVDSPAGSHREAFNQVAALYEAAAGVESDRKCHDISRCCYVSDDEGAWYNPDALTFHVSVDAAERFVREWLQRNPAVEGSRNQTVYKLGCEANRRGFTEESVARFCAPLMQADSFSGVEIEKALHSAYQSNTNQHGEGTVSCGHEKATTATGTILNAPPPPDDFPEEGEALREQTPFLSEELSELLPPLLNEALRYYTTDRREYDMALLAACTVLSACLPRVYGIYRRKRVFPHLFTVEVAPAANGKGCINDMRHLADRYASFIEIESARTEKDYLQALEEWELKKVEAHRNHQPVQVSEAPVRQSTCYFFIPAQITKAKLLIHLRDNGEIGGLMADSEIDTLISAGKQDYGAFDDLLRKAFHHEPVASSRKTDNEMISIPLPRLAMLLAGTPGQFSRLIPDEENGLLSRLLLYTCRTKAAWHDVSPGDSTVDLEKHLQALSDQVLDCALLLRKKPLQVLLTASQWNKLNIRFAALLKEADLFGNENFLSVVKRYGLITFRLCMVFTALDVAGGDFIPELRYCSDTHFQAALSITLACLEHSRLLGTQLHRNEEQPELTFPLKFRELFAHLPSEFTLQEAYALGASVNLPERTLRRSVKKLIPLYVSKLSRGLYKKTGKTFPEIV